MLQQFQLYAHQRSNAVSLNVYIHVHSMYNTYNIMYNNRIIQINIRIYICKYVGMYVYMQILYM